MSQQTADKKSPNSLFMFIAFVGIFLYGLLAALPGSVLATLERSQFLPNDSAVGTFLLINAIGAVAAYIVSGPIIDRIGNKIALIVGTSAVVLSMAGFALVVSKIAPTSALLPMFFCSLALGFGANAIVASGHALVAEVASDKKNAALNLLDICFGLGLAALPLVVQVLLARGGVELIFWLLGALSLIVWLLVITSRFPRPTHGEASPVGAAGLLFKNGSFLLLAIALFMYVGAEVSVGKWAVTFMERDPKVLASQGLDITKFESLARTPDLLNRFFESDAVGIAIAGYALKTLSFFAMALLAGRLVSSFLLGVLRVNSFVLMASGSLLTALALIVSFTADTASMVRLGLILTGLGMGPIFPTSVGLASEMMPEVAGTAMSLVMGVGFAGLLVIPPAVGYVSSWVGGPAGNVRIGLITVIGASVLMAVLHFVLLLTQRKRR